MIITPGLNAPVRTTSSGAIAPATTTTAASAPTQSPVVDTPASVYYWRGLIHVSQSKDVASSAVLAFGAGSVQAGAMAIFYKMSFALGALALGCVILL